MILGGQIDVHVDQVVSQVLREGVFGLLLIAAVLRKTFQVLLKAI